MGLCYSKPTSSRYHTADERPQSSHGGNYASTPVQEASPARTSKAKKSPFFGMYSPSPAHYLFSKNSPHRSSSQRSGSSTPKRLLKIPLSPARHIIGALARRRGTPVLSNSSSRSRSEFPRLDKSFGYSENFFRTYELGGEVGRGHFGHTCEARFKNGDLKGQKVAVKIIPKSEMTTAIAIEDVRREVKILKALSGHRNFVQFYEAFEDDDSVYIVMELCEGGELLDRILAKGGVFTEEAAMGVMIQILNAAAFCHLQGVVHRDLKPENFLFTTKDDNATLKVIDFGLSDFVKPDERLNDVVGSAYYVAPEVLHRSYTIEADIWSIGVIAYVLLCGSRPFWARTESGIFRAVLRTNPNFDDAPWPLISPEAKDFVKRLLNKDSRRRMSAAQALNHPWIKASNEGKIPLDITILKLLKGYVRSSSLRKAALRALSKTLTEEDVGFLKHQFSLLEPGPNGTINLDSVKMALMRNSTDAMIASRVPDFLSSLNELQYRRIDFEEFCAGAMSVHQLEGMDRWGFQARAAYEIFEEDGNRAIIIEELASELGVSSSVPVHEVLHDWIRHTDGKLSFLGFIKILHGVSSRTFAKGGVKP